MKVRIYDNPEVGDRYTAVFDILIDEEYPYLGFSADPFHPQGIGQHGSSTKLIDKPEHKHLGLKIYFDYLPIDGKRLVAQEFIYLSLFPDERESKQKHDKYEKMNHKMIMDFLPGKNDIAKRSVNNILDCRTSELENPKVLDILNLVKSGSNDPKQLKRLFKLIRFNVPKDSILYDIRFSIAKKLATAIL